jgi:hypothetical protein
VKEEEKRERKKIDLNKASFKSSVILKKKKKKAHYSKDNKLRDTFL